MTGPHLKLRTFDDSAEKVDEHRADELDPKWYKRAACLDHDRAIFFPSTAGGPAYAAARKICKACPVAGACLSSAMAEEHGTGRGGRWGMRGGLGPNERARFSAELRAAGATV